MNLEALVLAGFTGLFACVVYTGIWLRNIIDARIDGIETMLKTMQQQVK